MNAVRPDELNGLVDFDCPFRVTEASEVVTALPGIYAPSVCESEGSDGPECDDARWSFVDGYSGQDRYSGPVMHASEYLGGRMAADVLAAPGIYVVTTVEDADDADSPWGWALLRRVE